MIQPVTSLLINAITEKGIMRPGKGQEGGFLPLLELPLMMKVLSTWFTRAGRKCNNMDHMDKNI